MTTEHKAVTPEEVWSKIATPEKKTEIIKGVTQLVISLGLSPNEAGELLVNLDDETANGIAYVFSGVADGETVRLVGQELMKGEEV